jgi:ubiquinone/menaquinone biosynthesis C-methylase UbiE
VDAAETLREVVADHYSRSADRYATFENARSREQAGPVLDALPLDGASRVLDVGTGPGSLLPDLTRRSPGALVVGVDASEGALARARRDVSNPLAVMDSNRLALASDAFDVAVFSFSLFHLPDPAAGLGQAAVVLRSGGAVGIVTHDASASNDRGAATARIESMLDRLGDRIRPLPPVKEAATEEAVRALLEGGGFTSVRTWRAVHDVEIGPDGAELLARARARAPDIDPAEWSGFEDEVRATLATLPAEDFRFRLRFVYAIGSRAGT